MSAAPRRCLDDETVAAFVDGDLDPAERPGVEAHLGRCDDCAVLVAEYGKFRFQADEPEPGPSEPGSADERSAGSAAPDPSLGPGTRVSRYVLGRLIGRGGAGAVYQAHDPQLKRQVALKLLRPLPAPGIDEAAAQARLLHEAEAMARLSHPNVVAVHDAGVFEGHVFIVMELVEGETLSAWLRGADRAAPEILAVFLGAGRGLEAAHAAGLVHGDFKPQNVIVGRDGRPRVTDFGLARPATAGAGGATAAGRRGATIAGGTPLFMAPEQHRGARASAASDQFAFALALYRALHGRDPFGLQARRAWAAGAPGGGPEVRGAAAISPRLQEAILRALAVTPEARFPSLTELLATLEEALGRRRARRFGGARARAAALAAVVLAGAALVSWRALVAPRCGNGVVEAGEECDDGNDSNADGCLATCGYATCGDGFVRAPVEDCDDGPQGGACPGCRRCDGGEAAFLREVDGHCYTRHAERLAWDEAAAFCNARGATLVSYGTAAEAAAVAAALVTGETDTWIGLRRLREYGFVWASGDPWVEPLPRWWSRVPKPQGQDCVHQVAEAPDGDIRIGARWPTAACDERRGFVCEASAWRVRRPGNHAYRVFYRKLRWSDAAEACRAIGAHLATLTDADEHGFVARVAAADAWIGARTEGLRGPFTWVTGEPFAFTAFPPNEPDMKTAPACVALGADGLWHDRGCGDRSNYYICEVD